MKRGKKQNLKNIVSALEMLEKSEMTNNDDTKPTAHPPLTTQDKFSVVILLILYTLQGIPMGLSGSIPLILKEKGVSYEALSLFSLVSIPFSLKLLWAPFVDSCYIKSFGRRKSWLIPVQICTAIAMFWGAGFINHWLDESHTSVRYLTIYFLLLYFLMATQDIAVDGWALTMLSRDNVGMASMCNSVGQTVGIFLANQGFIALSDSHWCHKYLGMELGTSLITLSGFMHFWGYVFLVTTLGLWIFKTEEPVEANAESDGESPDLATTIKQIGSIFKLPPVHTITWVLLTCRVAFAASDAAFGFKLQEYGMPKADISMVSPLLLAVGLFLPAMLSHVVTVRPLDTLLIGVPLKILTSASLWFVLQSTKTAYADGASPGMEFFAPLIFALLLHEVASSLVFNSLMAYFSKVSDPSIGGSYMTLLNTLTNLGAKWPSSLCLWLLPKMTFTACQLSVNGVLSVLQLSCGVDNNACEDYGGTCSVNWDGYTIQTVFCFLFGVVWFYFFRNSIRKLQVTPYSDWLVASSTMSSANTSMKTVNNDNVSVVENAKLTRRSQQQ